MENYILKIRPNVQYTIFPKIYTEYTIDNFYKSRDLEEEEHRKGLCKNIMFEGLIKSRKNMDVDNDFINYYKVHCDKPLDFNVAVIELLKRV